MPDSPTDNQDPGFHVLENIQRDRNSGKVLSRTYWVGGPNGYLAGPFSEEEAEARVDEFNKRLYQHRRPDASDPAP